MRYTLPLSVIVASAVIMGFIVPALWKQGSSTAFEIMLAFVVVSVIGTTVGLIFLFDAAKKDLLKLKRTVFGGENVG